MQKFEFKEDDLFINRIKTYPEYNISIYMGKCFVNKHQTLSGSGGLTVFEANENRQTGLIYPFISASSRKDIFRSQVYQPIVSEYLGNNYYINFYNSRISGSGKVTSYPPPDQWLEWPSLISQDYGYESPIKRKLVGSVSTSTLSYFDMQTAALTTQNLAHTVLYNISASALQNVARKYTVLSDHFIFVSSSSRPRDLVYGTPRINFIFIPQMYYGSSIKKGSVSLNFRTTGSMTARCEDKNHNGVLIETTGSNAGKPVGLVLYDEGIIMLTASHNLQTVVAPAIRYDGTSTQNPSWFYYGTGLNDNITHATLSNASYDLNFKGTSYVNTMTMLAHADKGQLNHSNNPTYRDLNYSRNFQTSSGPVYYESESDIKNIVSASYTSASFEKTTYISKINIYDENENLIGVTRLATPVKKTLNRDYTFKLKLDI